jgi:hypothetical protein
VVVAIMTQQTVQTGNFADKLLNLLDRIEYRRVETGEDMEDVARLRYKAYKVNNLIKLSGSMLMDDIDFDKNAYVFGIYVEEQLVSTIRIHHVTPEHRVSLSGKIFPDTINAFLDAGMTLIDPVRLAADPDVVNQLPGIQYLTLRIGTMASDYFGADRVLQSVDASHAAFYRRMFLSEVVVEPLEKNENYNVNLTLLATQVKTVLPKLYERYPALKSEAFERRAMFDRSYARQMASLTILPTARYAARSEIRLAAA